MNLPRTGGSSGLDLTSAQHICNVLRRQVADEFPHITFQLIACHAGGEEDALAAKKQELMEHPAGDLLLNAAQILMREDGPVLYPVFAIAEEKKILSFFKKEKFLFTCFIQIERFDDAEDFRQHVLSLIWHGFSLFDHWQQKEEARYQIAQGVICPVHNETMIAWHNMLADAFSAVFLELQGHKGSLKKLAQQRCLMPLMVRKGWVPEHYPFPLAMEAADIVYQEISNFTETREGPMQQAISMTREIGETFDLNTMTQWQIFARAAQDMAWGGADKNVILGATIHTSEDPYVRATAYMIAEFLGVEPVLSLDPDLYNPFSDPEISERHHRRACEDIFMAALSQASFKNNALVFCDEAMASHQRLADGRLTGWCGYALFKAGEAFRSAPSPVEAARHAFGQALQAVPWPALQELHHLMVQERRKGRAMALEQMQKIAADSALNLPPDLFKIDTPG